MPSSSIDRYSTLETNMSVDYSVIHRHLKQLKASHAINQAPDHASGQLDEQTALTYITSLRHDLISSVDQITITSNFNSNTLNEIITLTKTLDFVPKSDILFALFDSQLFSSLFYLLGLPSIPIEALRGILRICLTYLAGVLPKNRRKGMFQPLLNVLCEKLPEHDLNRCDIVFENLTSKITFADARMNLNIVDFVAKVLYRLVETMGVPASAATATDDILSNGDESLLRIINSLYVFNFFGVLSCIRGIGEIESMTGLRGSLELTANWLTTGRVSSDSWIWIKCCALMEEVGITLSTEDIQDIDTLSILSLVGVFSQSKMLLKKIMVECNMTSTFPILKFMSALNTKLTNEKTINRIFGIWNTDLWYSILNISTHCWLLSGATVENDDTQKVINMIDVVIAWIVEEIDKNTETFGENSGNISSDYDVALLLAKVDTFDYDEIKNLQLKSIRENRLKVWSNEMQPFENMVHTEVIELVSDRKFMQLSKGSWVYLQNPLQTNENTYLFITLNSNSQSIIYKEFPKKHSKVFNMPNLDKDGIMIEFKNITGIECENMNPQVDDSGLIILRSERMDVNKVEIFTKTGSLIFYVDTKQLKDAWVDGLRILVSDSKSVNKKSVDSAPMKQTISEQFFLKSGVSKDVKKQVKILEDIRLRTQMLYLDNPEFDPKNANPLEVNWKNLNVNFNYE